MDVQTTAREERGRLERIGLLQRALVEADKAGNEADAYDLARALKNLMSEQNRHGLATRYPGEYDPRSHSFRRNYGATSGQSGLDVARAGAGKAFYDIGRGVKQLTGNMTREEVDERKALDAELASTTAGKVGNVVGNAAIAAPTMFIPGANTYIGAAAIGAGLGALQPVGTDDSRAQNMLMGAGGAMAGKFVGDRVMNWAARPQRLPQTSASQATGDAAIDTATAAGTAADINIRPGQATAATNITGTVEMGGRGGGYTFGHVGDDASAGLGAAERSIMQRGQAIGMRPTPGQATGSRALQQMEAKLESQPMTSGPFNTIKANNARVLSRTWARAIGENADSLDSAVLDRAATRIGEVFDDAGDDVVRSIEPQKFLETYSNIQQEVRGLTKGFDNHPLIEDLVGFAHSGSATGKQLQTLTSKLGKSAYKEMTSPTGDRDLGMALYQAKDYVDDLLQQGMSAGRKRTFQQARGQYRNLMLLTSRSTVINPSTGTVNPRSLASVLQMKDKAGYTYGRNQTPAYDAVRFAQAFQPIVGDSGTATRVPLQGVTDFFARVPLNIATRAYTSSPGVTAALRAQAASQAAGRATSAAAARTVVPVSNFARRNFGTAPYYAPYVLPGQVGIFAPQLAGE